MFTRYDVEKYFVGEKQESLLFLLIGIAGIVTAGIFYFVLKTNFYNGASIPFLIIGLLLAIIGFTVYKKSDDDRQRNVYAYDMNPSVLKNKELPRMKTVMKNFIVYRFTEIILAATGIALFFYFRGNSDKFFWKGFGFALAVMALLALTTDFFAEKRGRIYVKGIESFTQGKA